jgi:hypothetical protein
MVARLEVIGFYDFPQCVRHATEHDKAYFLLLMLRLVLPPLHIVSIKAKIFPERAYGRSMVNLQWRGNNLK